jgi:hypothetical protein
MILGDAGVLYGGAGDGVTDGGLLFELTLH